MVRTFAAALTAALVLLTTSTLRADPFPPTWDNGTGAAIHYQPANWPSEPANPVNCGNECGDWKPYTRFQQSINDPRNRDPSNGGTSPQSFVNVSSSCADTGLPSIYYYLHQGATPQDDILMFRWRVESGAHNYATGPNPGTFGAGHPWSSALWTVLFDIDGSGYRSLAAHLDGSSGSPATPIDMLVGIWGNTASHSLDYNGDPNVHLLSHNPTAFIGPGNRILNFQSNLNPTENWPNGSAETVWDYGTTRAKLVSKTPCTEYFIDYQIPIAMLDASHLGGPAITRNTPIAMTFCTANSLNNPFQKDCAVNKRWSASPVNHAPFGDYLSFNREAPYSQPIVSSVKAAAPTSCPGAYTLEAVVQDTLALQDGVVVPSVQAVDFYYWYDANGDGQANDPGSAWTRVANAASLKSGSLNTWRAQWDASNLPKGKYLIGVQALDDHTMVDDGMVASGINNRTFSYLSGNDNSEIYIAGSWVEDQESGFPEHAQAQVPGLEENWYGNPDVTGQQLAIVGTAINACGVAPTLSLSAGSQNVIAGSSVDFTLIFFNPGNNSSAVFIDQAAITLPTGFSYQTNSALGSGGLPSVNPVIAGNQLVWTYDTPVALASGDSASIDLTLTASSVAGHYNAQAEAETDFGTLNSDPVGVAVDAARVSLSAAPDSYSIPADGSTPLTVTFFYGNDTSIELQSATLTSVLPEGLILVNCGGVSTCQQSGSSLVWDLGDLPSGHADLATVTLLVPSSWSSPSLTLSAEVSTTAPGGSLASAVASTAVAVTGYNVAGVPALSLVKGASVVQIAPGGTVTYTLNYHNYGGATANNLVIEDVLPSGLTFVSATGGGQHSAGLVTWALGNLAAGASGSVMVTATAADPFTHTNPAQNQAVVYWQDGGPVASNAVNVGVTGQACSAYYFTDDLADVGFDGNHRIASSGAVPEVSDPGASVTVTAPVSGAAFLEALRFYQDPEASSQLPFDGDITTNIYIDRVNGQGLNVRATVYDYNSVTGDLVQLAQHTQTFQGSAKGLLSFTAPTSGTLNKDHRLLWVYAVRSVHNSQTVEVQIQYGGTVPNNFSGGTTFANSNAHFCVTPPASLGAQVSVDQPGVAAGATPTLTYTIQYANSGSAGATGAQLVTELPGGLSACEYSTDSINWFSCSNSGAEPAYHQFNLGTVAGGASGSVYLRGDIPAGTTGGEIFTQQVSLVSDQTSAVFASADTLVTGGGGVEGAPVLSLSLAASASSAVPGDTVDYTLTVVNVGDAGAEEVNLASTLPLQSYFTYGSCSHGCNIDAATLNWIIGNVAAGSSRTVNFSMQVGGNGLPAGTTLLSLGAEASGAGGIAASAAPIQLSVNGNPLLSASISAVPDEGLRPGDVVRYSLAVTNIGNASASSVQVVAPVAVHTAYAGELETSIGSGSFDTVNNRLVFSLGELEPGSSAVISFDVVVGELASGTTNIVQSASVNAANAAQQVFDVTVQASAEPLLELIQTASGDGAFPAATVMSDSSGMVLFVDRTDSLHLQQWVRVGDTVARIVELSTSSLTLDTSVVASSGEAVVGAIELAFNYRNIGDAVAVNASLNEILPAGLEFFSASPAANTTPGVGSSGEVVWHLGDVSPGAGGTRSLLIFPDGTTGAFNSQALLSADNADDTSADLLLMIGGIAVTKTTDTPVLAPANPAIYRITLTNSLATDVPGVTVSDWLPAGFSYRPGSALVGGVVMEPAFAAEDLEHNRPIWSGLTVPGNSYLVVEFHADVNADLGADTYHNEVDVLVPNGIGLKSFDALSSKSEDVNLLGSGLGVVRGHVFYRSSSDAEVFDPGSDIPLVGVRLEIHDGNGDCSNPFSTDCYVVYTDVDGYFEQVLPTGAWQLEAIAGSGDLDMQWTQVLGTNSNTITILEQGEAWDYKGFALVDSFLVTATAGTGGSIDPDSRLVIEGATANFTLLAEVGYSLDEVSGCEGTVDGNTYITGPILEACDILASFSRNRYIVTFDLGEGQLTEGELVQEVEHGADATAPQINPPAGMLFNGWDADFTNVMDTLTVGALYIPFVPEIQQYQVTVQVGTGGQVNPSGVVTLAQGQSAVFSVAPDQGFTLGQVTGTCGGQVSGHSYTLDPVTAHCSLMFSFYATLDVEDDLGNPYGGELLRRDEARSFRVSGGGGLVQLAATVLQSGTLHILDGQDPDEFFQSRGATLIDNGDGSYSFSARRAGVYMLSFIDEQGQQVHLEFTVYPEVAFTRSEQIVAPGEAVVVNLVLDDDPVEYPNVVAYRVDNHWLAATLDDNGYVYFDHERSAAITFMAGDEPGNIDFRLEDEGSQNLVPGGLREHRVVLQEKVGVPLAAQLVVYQEGGPARLVFPGRGTVSALVSLVGDEYSYDWSGSDSSLGIGHGDSHQVSFDPVELLGRHRIQVTITELLDPYRSITLEAFVTIVPDVPAAYWQIYGAAYQEHPHRLPICIAGGMQRVQACRDITNAIYMETMEGYQLRLGRSSDYASWRAGEFALSLERMDIRDNQGVAMINAEDPQYQHLGYMVDFEVAGLEQPGQSVPVVIPLQPGLVIGEGMVWRKYLPQTGWGMFNVDARNSLWSASRDSTGQCPWAGSDSWQPGLNPGDDCVRLIIEDGGPNDQDGSADGVVRDPGTLAVRAEPQQVTTRSKGGGMVDGYLVMLALLWLLHWQCCRVLVSNSQCAGRKGKRPVAVTATAFLLLVPAALAEQQSGDNTRFFYAGVGGAVVRGQIDADTLSRRMAEQGYSVDASVDGQSRFSWDVRGGYRWSPYFATELTYVDLGRVTTRITGAAADIDDYLGSAHRSRPRSASGPELAIMGLYPLGESLEISARVGVLYASADYRASHDGASQRQSRKHTSPTYGVGLAYHLNPRWQLQVGIDRYDIDGEMLGRAGLTLVRRFYRGD